jgi:hypothetical protein
MANDNPPPTPDRHGEQRNLPSMDPAVQRAEAWLKRTIGEPPCPMCGHTDWGTYSRDVGLTLAEPSHGEAAAFHALLIYCLNCQFIRLHGIPSNV